MIVVREDRPNVFNGQKFILSDDQKKGIDAIADMLVNNPGRIKNLLTKYNVAVSQNPSRQELLSGLFVAFQKDKMAMRDFAASKVTGKPATELHDSVRSNAVTGPNEAENGDSGTGTTSTTNAGGYVGAISGIFGAVASIFSTLQGPNANAAISETNNQILALAMEKEKTKKRNTTIAIVVLSVLAIVGGALVVVYYKKQN